MIIDRSEFRIKFGMMKEALACWKLIKEELKKEKDPPHIRILTDITGQAYTLVLEIQLRNFNDFGLRTYQFMTNEKIEQIYHEQFSQICESSYRSLYKIEVED